MERNEFTKRLKRLIVWILAVAVITYCGHNVGMYVLAAEGDENDTTITLPVTRTTDGKCNISISGDYTLSVTLDKNANTATVTLPEVEVTTEGYIFEGWKLNISGGGIYTPGVQQVTWDEAVPASTLSAVHFIAQCREENKINVSYVIAAEYGNIAQVEDVAQTEYKESVHEPIITLPGVTDSSDEYVFAGWKCFDASEYENGIKNEIIIDGYEENYCESGISVYPEDVVLEFTYPTDGEDTDGNTASYVFEAQFITAKTVKVAYDTKGGDAMEVMEQTIYQKSIDDVAISLILPQEPTYEGYSFEGWIGENLKTYEAGSNVTIDLGAEVTFTALWVPIVGEGSREIINIGPYKLDEGTWKLEGDDSIYPGGIFFYAPEKGVYTFTPQ